MGYYPGAWSPTPYTPPLKRQLLHLYEEIDRIKKEIFIINNCEYKKSNDLL